MGTSVVITLTDINCHVPLQQKEQTSLLARLRETNETYIVGPHEDKKAQTQDKEKEAENKVSIFCT